MNGRKRENSIYPTTKLFEMMLSYSSNNRLANRELVRIFYSSYMRTEKVQTRLRKCAVLSGPVLLVHTEKGDS